MNPNLAKLQPYPFEKLRLGLKDITPDARCSASNLGIGEPKHPAPGFIREALAQNLSGLAKYPATAGTPVLREATAAWGDETHVAENRRPMENTASNARLSSNARMPRLGPRPASTSCYAEVGKTTRATTSRGS